jgi:TonB family protein
MASPGLRTALCASALLHILGAAVVGEIARWKELREATDVTVGEVEPVEVEVVSPPATLTLPEPGAPVDTVPGPADAFSDESLSPWPRADVDTPELTPAGRGGGASGGTPTWTGRHDQETWRSQAWNDPFDYRLGRHRTSDERASDESIPRLPDPGLSASARERRRLARTGERAEASPAAGEPWDDLDPRWDDGPRVGAGGAALVASAGTGSATQLREEGAVVIRAGRPLVLDGPAATEAPEDGPTQDDTEAAQASNERQPGAFEMTQPRAGAGADGEGVAGPEEGEGPSRRADNDGDGEGGSRADVPRGNGLPAMRARLQDDYFRKLYARVLDRVTFPPRLAVTLEQGEVTVAFVLKRDGSVANVRISRSSGFSEFDDAVVKAVRQAAPFGPLPAAIAGPRSTVLVNAPFSFDNPLIR